MTDNPIANLNPPSTPPKKAPKNRPIYVYSRVKTPCLKLKRFDFTQLNNYVRQADKSKNDHCPMSDEFLQRIVCYCCITELPSSITDAFDSASYVSELLNGIIKERVLRAILRVYIYFPLSLDATRHISGRFPISISISICSRCVRMLYSTADNARPPPERKIVMGVSPCAVCGTPGRRMA